ncbi:MAG TPA: MOSC domain-containing protein [Acidimicrobiales bacterium]|nr:MOSC domain-containing protein [Acidimicrobiales bacterium]
MHVSEIWRYPVKSMVGGRVESATLDARGIVGDRTWAVRDQVRGGIRGAKVLGGLMRLSARYADGDGGAALITLPDGATVSTDDPEAAAAVSAAIGHEVTLERLRPAEDREHYRRGAPYHDDLMDELRAIFGRTEDEPLPDLSVFPPEILEHESPPGTYHDAFPLMLMTTSALRALRDALPASAVDVRRFRPSIVIDTGDQAGHPELGWAGRRLRVGEAVLALTTPCPRCVMVTREIDEATPQDRSILRHVVKELDQNVGMYADVHTPGTIRTGDPVAFAD